VKDLAPGEILRVASGSIIAFERNVHYDVQMVKGAKNILFVCFFSASLIFFMWSYVGVLRVVRVCFLHSSLGREEFGCKAWRSIRSSAQLRRMLVLVSAREQQCSVA
jgi:hypothetical protein